MLGRERGQGTLTTTGELGGFVTSPSLRRASLSLTGTESGAHGHRVAALVSVRQVQDTGPVPRRLPEQCIPLRRLRRPSGQHPLKGDSFCRSCWNAETSLSSHASVPGTHLRRLQGTCTVSCSETYHSCACSIAVFLNFGGVERARQWVLQASPLSAMAPGQEPAMC